MSNDKRNDVDNGALGQGIGQTTIGSQKMHDSKNRRSY